MLTPISLPEPFIGWADVDRHLRLDGDTDQRELVESYAAAACAALDGPNGRTQRALAPQTWAWRLRRVTRRRLDLPLPPLIAVEEVTFDGASFEGFEVGGVGADAGGWIEAAGWPSGEAVVTFTAGYSDVADSPPTSGVPAPLKVAALMIVADLFRNRGEAVSEDMTENPAIERLIAPYCTWRS